VRFRKILVNVVFDFLRTVIDGREGGAVVVVAVVAAVVVVVVVVAPNPDASSATFTGARLRLLRPLPSKPPSA
jgi:hypothetical protein